jgi:hypothetical protein
MPARAWVIVAIAVVTFIVLRHEIRAAIRDLMSPWKDFD